MEHEVTLKTRPLTASQLQKTLVAAAPRVADVFGDEGRGLAWQPATLTTRLIHEAEQGRLLEDLEHLGWGNGRLSFSFGVSAKYYEGQPRLHTSLTFSLIKPRVIGFCLTGTERPGEPIASVTFGWGFITDAQAAALREIFAEVLGDPSSKEPSTETKAKVPKARKSRSPKFKGG